jgi:hypothetical protein
MWQCIALEQSAARQTLLPGPTLVTDPPPWALLSPWLSGPRPTASSDPHLPDLPWAGSTPLTVDAAPAGTAADVTASGAAASGLTWEQRTGAIQATLNAALPRPTAQLEHADSHQPHEKLPIAFGFSAQIAGKACCDQPPYSQTHIRLIIGGKHLLNRYAPLPRNLKNYRQYPQTSDNTQRL